MIYHWPFFFQNSGLSIATRQPLLPFQKEIGAIYQYGYLAVDLFFGISGFVFFWLYAEDVAQRRISALTFAVRRLSRLYPLHLLTLAVVVAGQSAMLRLTGGYLAYEWNDLRHFVLNLFMASSWGFERDMSFNGPAWSVSVEVALYAAFFVFCRFAPRKTWLMLAVAFASRLIFRGYFPLGRGLWSFFVGGVIAQWYADAKKRPASELKDRGIVAATVAFWIATLIAVSPAFGAMPWVVSVTGIHDPQRTADLLQSIGHNWVRAVLFPATIVSVLVLDRKFGARLRSLERLGAISYGIYLWHFPLILFTVLGAVAFGTSREVFASPIFLAAFLCILIAWSLVSFRRFERPMQTWLRVRFPGER